MGLKSNLAAIEPNNSYRENITDAYFKIEGVFVDTNKAKVRIQVRGWLSEYARHNQGIGIYKRVFYAPIENFFKGFADGTTLIHTDFIIESTANVINTLVSRGYEFIKTLPDFSNSTDVLDEYSGDIDITEEIAQEQEQTLDELINSLKD
jgi:hypothetical protein